MTKNHITIKKNSGESVAFDELKLRHSLERSGANELVISQIIKEIESILYTGISTKELYKKAFASLRKHSRHTAARYKLKSAIQELGPSGFPFEQFVAEILKHQGFRTHVGVIIKGHCVNHEVDIVAQKENEHFLVECKFHNTDDKFCNVKIPLYVQSRFLDIVEELKKSPGYDDKFHKGWVVTNTRFTKDAIQYGQCAGLHLLGWKFPRHESLEIMIDKSGLYPITSLTTLTKAEKQKLLDKKIVLSIDLCKNENYLTDIGISKIRSNQIIMEAKQLCKLNNGLCPEK